MLINPERLTFTEKDFDELTKELKDLLFNRGKSYNNVSVVHDYFPYQPESYNQMIYLKVLRELNKTDQQEFDSIKDLLVYGMFKWDFYRKQALVKKEIT